MLSRKERFNDKPVHLPDSWKHDIKNLLDNIYKNDLEKLQKTFIIHGLTYPDEVCIAVSLLDCKDSLTSPVAYLMSSDLNEKSDSKKLISTLIDSVGVFFDQYFVCVDWNDYQARWEEIEFAKTKFFYKISRENIALSMISDELLQDSTDLKNE